MVVALPFNRFKMLDLNRYFYEYMLRTKIQEAQAGLSDTELLKRISLLANFAWRNHPGYYCDGRLENILVAYGKNLESYINRQQIEKQIPDVHPNEDTHNSIVHVATRLFGVGGHTRALYQFIKRHKANRHVVVLTGQSLKQVPQWFAEGIGDTPILTLDLFDSPFERAWVLRRSAAGARCVILYHHSDDVVPIMAFSDTGSPPVLLLNHAHSWFWLGASVSDLVLAPTEFHTQFTLATRPITNVSHFPFTQLDDLDTDLGQNDKQEAKKRLGIDPDAVCIMTIGTPEKFIPNARYNFYRTAQQILQRFEQVELYVIGIADSPDLRKKYHLQSSRIHFCGFVDRPDDYYKAADICLDALPQPSLGATLYAALIGLACPVFKYGHSNMFNGKNFIESPLYRQQIGTLDTEKEYLDTIGFLIGNPEIRIRIAEEIRAGYCRRSSNAGLCRTIQGALEQADALQHSPRTIPVGTHHRDADSAEIADAGALQDLHSRLSYFDGYLSHAEKIAILAQLALKPGYTGDVMQLTKKLMKNKLSLFDCFRNSRRNYGSSDSVLSAPVSPHSGK